MIKYLKISNKGVLDKRLLSLMGGTTKDTNSFKIGQWGSGLKYAMAWLIKNNVDFKICLGGQQVNVSTENEVIAGEPFDVIVIDGVKTSITTKMGGHDWKAWMIIRELYCNALDEGEYSVEETYDISCKDGWTSFYVQITPDIKEVLDNWDKYFIHKKEPVWQSNNSALYKNYGTSLKIYKQGVLIYEDKNAKSSFSYDLKNADINELREFRGTPSYAIIQCISGADKKGATFFLENIKEDDYEAKMDWNWYISFEKGWKEAIGSGKLIHHEAVKTLKEKGQEIDLSDKIVVPKAMYSALSAQFEGIGSLRVADKVGEFYEIYDQKLETQINKGLAILDSIGYSFSPELKFIYGVFGNKEVQARVNLDSKEVWISENMLNSTLFEVCAMLIEENEHFKTGFSDCTRSFQQHFINLYTNVILKQGGIEL